jgi:hypothetical protein
MGCPPRYLSAYRWQRRKTTADISGAIADWESDLKWLTNALGR